MQRPLILAAFDVRRASQPETSRIKIITKMVLPPIKLKTVEVETGGGVAAVNYSLPRTEVIEPKWETKGPDLDAFDRVGLVAGAEDMWIFTGSLIQRRGADPLPIRAIVSGIVSELDLGEASAGEANDCTHALTDVEHYEIHIGNNEKFYLDVDEPDLRFNGKSLISPHLRALGL